MLLHSVGFFSVPGLLFILSFVKFQQNISRGVLALFPYFCKALGIEVWVFFLYIYTASEISYTFAKTLTVII